MEFNEALAVVESAEGRFDDGQFEAALAAVRTLYGNTLPSSLRGRAFALETACLEGLMRYQDADRLIETTMAEEGDDLAFVQAAGVAFSELGLFDHAETFLRNLCELDPDTPAPWYNLAVALGREERYQDAVAAYEEAIRRAPHEAEFYLQKGHCQHMQGDLAGAAASLRSYLELSPEDAESWTTLGVIESEQGHTEAAYAAYRESLGRNGDPVDVYYNWAVTAVRAGDMGGLERCLEKLEEADPEDWRTLLTRADYEEAQGNLWQAWECLSEAVDCVLDLDADELAELEDDPAGYVVAAALRFAARNDMEVHAESIVERVFEEAIFDDEALEAMRELYGEPVDAAASYSVVVSVVDEGAGRTYRTYGVCARNEGEARDLVAAFEQRCGSAGIRLESVEAISGLEPGKTGVYWRSEDYD